MKGEIRSEGKEEEKEMERRKEGRKKGRKEREGRRGGGREGNKRYRACCEHILARVIIGRNGCIANSRRIDARNSRIGRCWRREFEEGIPNIHYKFVRE